MGKYRIGNYRKVQYRKLWESIGQKLIGKYRIAVQVHNAFMISGAKNFTVIIPYIIFHQLLVELSNHPEKTKFFDILWRHFVQRFILYFLYSINLLLAVSLVLCNLLKESLFQLLCPMSFDAKGKRYIDRKLGIIFSLLQYTTNIDWSTLNFTVVLNVRD